MLAVMCSSVTRASNFNPGLELVKKENYATALNLLFPPFATSNDGVEAANKGDYKAAIKIWRALAEQGDDDAQYNLGLIWGKVEYYEEAVKWLLLAAEQGHEGAQNNLGLMYIRGKGVTQDYEKSAKWFRLAAEQGNVNAQWYLGNMQRDGVGVIQDYKEAVSWFRKAAEQGHADAQCDVF